MEVQYLPVSRVLTPLEIQLFSYLGSEREACALAPFVYLPEHATYNEIENAVCAALVRVKEARDGRAQVEYITGQRRDLLRGRT
jgi:hypothetical protein